MKNLFLSASLVLSLGAFCQSIPNIDTIANVTAPGTNAFGSSTAVNKVNGNVYITGYIQGTTKDLFVAKYDSQAVQLWFKTFDNGAADIGTGIYVDPATDYCYVTGSSEQSGNADIITIGYNASGTALWTSPNRFNGTANSADAGNSITFDGSYVWVGGYSTTTSKMKDATVLKIDGTSGALVASKKANGTANSDDVFNKVFLKGTNLFVTGAVTNSGTGADVLIACINTVSASITWTAVANGSSSSNDAGMDITADANHVVVCGSLVNSGTGSDYFYAVLTPSTGAITYSTSYDGGFSGTDVASSITKDKLGNYILTGAITNGSSLTEYHTQSYTASGRNWTHPQQTNTTYTVNYPHVTVDTLNHIYVCGTYSNSTLDAFIYQLTPSGNRTWPDTYDNPTYGARDINTDLVVDGLGRIYVISLNESGTATNTYYVKLLKYSQTPVYMPCNYNLQADTFSMTHLFYPNGGEIRDTALNPVPEVLFYTKYTYPGEFILKNAVAFNAPQQDTARVNPKDTLNRVDMTFIGANEHSEIFPVDYQANAKLSYFLSYTGTNGITGVAGASHLIVPNIYPLIDLHYSSNGNGAKYYFVVKPGGDPKKIMMQFSGPVTTTLTSNKLKVNLPNTSFTFNKPDIYYVSVPSFTNLTVSTTSVTGTNGWVSMGSDTYSINPGTYNTAWPLVIEFDKGKMAGSQNINNINWSTYIGSPGLDRIQESKCDPDTNLFIVGQTFANSFPSSPGHFQSSLKGNSDGFISKFDKTGVLLWSSYVGSLGDERLNGLDFNPLTKKIYCVGYSTQAGLSLQDVGGTAPTWSYTGTTGKQDGLIVQFDQNGLAAKWITYFGGSDLDVFTACQFDPNGDFFVVGYSKSTDFIVSRTNGTEYQHTIGGTSSTDGVILRFDPSYNLTWSTAIGSNTTCGYSIPDDFLLDCAISDAGGYDLYVVGSAYGCNYPNVSTGSGSTNRAYAGYGDMAVTHFSNIGNMVYSATFGGPSGGGFNGYDEAYAITIKHGYEYIGGSSNSNSITPVNGGKYYYQSSIAGLYNGAFLILDAGDVLQHYTYIGGSGFDGITDVLIDNNNTIYLAGATSSSDFPAPVSNPINTYSQSYKGSYDNFICALQQWYGIVWMTYLGGTKQETSGGFYDRSASICYDMKSNIFLTGLTQSDSTQQFPLDNGGGIPWFSKVLNGSQDASVTKFDVVSLMFVGVKENAKPVNDNISVYPNPTSGRLNVMLKADNEVVFYRIFDCTGREISSGKFTERFNTLSLNNLSNGIYFLETRDKTTTSSVKFVKNE